MKGRAFDAREDSSVRIDRSQAAPPLWRSQRSLSFGAFDSTQGQSLQFVRSIPMQKILRRSNRQDCPRRRECAMSTKVHKPTSLSQLFTQQVILNFVVVAVLIVLGALLVFKVYGEAYTQMTVLGFVAAVFFSFVVFLPAGTLFASRAEFAKGRVVVAASEKTGAR